MTLIVDGLANGVELQMMWSTLIMKSLRRRTPRVITTTGSVRSPVTMTAVAGGALEALLPPVADLFDQALQPRLG